MNLYQSGGKFKRYYDAIKYLEALGNISGGYQKTNLKSHPRPEMFLERMQDLLDSLGNPERGFKYIHITGTAGKGSVASMAHNQLVKSGKKVGLFTSPFTVSTIEKIQVGGKYIDPLILADLTEELKPSIDKEILLGKHGAPSYFEMMLAIALLYFKIEKCEFVILEVGLGGRYDATNIIKRPLITAITNIGLDHINILGSRRVDIANDKSGIIKKGSAFFTTEEDQKILGIFRDQCRKVGAEFNRLKIEGFDYESRNRLLAGSICKHIGVMRNSENMAEVVSLPARFEIMETEPTIVIDGAHNPLKIESTVYNLNKLEFQHLHLVVAISADKDWKTMLKLIVPKARAVYLTRFSIPDRQSVDPKLLFNEAKRHLGKNADIRLYSDPIQAYQSAQQKLRPSDLLLVTGSFYLAGDIRRLYHSEEEILRKRVSF